MKGRLRDLGFDNLLFWSVVLLLSFGLVMVFSSTVSNSMDRYFFLKRQLIFLSVSLIFAILVFQFSIEFFRVHAAKLFLFSLILLIAVLIPGVGVSVNGARRWISLGFTNFQPSEFVKIAVVLYAADYSVRKAEFMHSVRKGFIPMAIAIFFTGILLLLEPDFGSFVVIASIAMGILFLAGIKISIFVLLIGIVVASFVGLIFWAPYRLERVAIFLDPWSDPFNRGYQLSHSLIAVGRGALTGVGLGNSIEKLDYLPEAHTDFIMAVIAEEFGLVGVVVLISLFMILIYRCFMIAKQSLERSKYFESLVAQGAGIWFGVQVFINVGVNVGLLPTKGLTLPLLSYGGSSLLSNLIILAIIFRIDRENRIKKGS